MISVRLRQICPVGTPAWPLAAAFSNNSRDAGEAVFALGAMYSGGHKIPMDREVALKWFRAAAEMGHGHAQLMLGRYLANGVAGEQNPKDACHWLERAIAQGVPEAESDMAQLMLPVG
jgi:TPR repeat protein